MEKKKLVDRIQKHINQEGKLGETTYISLSDLELSLSDARQFVDSIKKTTFEYEYDARNGRCSIYCDTPSDMYDERMANIEIEVETKDDGAEENRLAITISEKDDYEPMECGD